MYGAYQPSLPPYRGGALGAAARLHARQNHGMTKKPSQILHKGIDLVAPMLYQWKSRKHLRSAGAADRDRDHPPNATLPGTDQARPDSR